MGRFLSAPRPSPPASSPDTNCSAGTDPSFRNVYAPKDQELALHDRTVAAWLWSSRLGIAIGLAAAALHGSRWIDDDIDVELIHCYSRAPRGIVTRNERIASDEWEELKVAIEYDRRSAPGRSRAISRGPPYMRR